MAQTSSAAREPSMEEILASIRRIIEDSDVTRAQPAPVSAAPARGPERGEVAAFRRPAPVEDRPQAEPQAVFRDEPVLRGPVAENSFDALPENDTEAEEEDEIVLDAENDDHHRQDIVHPEEHETHAAAPEETIRPPVAEVQSAESASEDRPEPKSGPHILSQAAERQVAAAFQDLDHAVHAGPRRSFDEIAAEILRPMLREWLDGHLPALVERLVREEIERVVRGGR